LDADGGCGGCGGNIPKGGIPIIPGTVKKKKKIGLD